MDQILRDRCKEEISIFRTMKFAIFPREKVFYLTLKKMNMCTVK